MQRRAFSSLRTLHRTPFIFSKNISYQPNLNVLCSKRYNSTEKQVEGDFVLNDFKSVLKKIQQIYRPQHEDFQLYLQEAKKRGKLPSVTECNAFIEKYVNNNQLERANVVYATMKEEKIAPNLKTFTLLIEGFKNAGLPDRAVIFAREKIEAGY